MDWVLYHPEWGYYSTAQPKIGTAGDFFTAPHLGRDFGELLAEQLAQMWEILGQPQPFTLVEMGAGQGILAADILRHFHQQYPQIWPHLNYIIIERSPLFQVEQAQTLKSWCDRGGSIQWRQCHEIDQNSITGCYFSNELVDAFPVHQIRFRNGQLQEVYVTTNPDVPPGRPSEPQFQEVIGEPSTPKLAEYFLFLGIELNCDRYPDPYRTEVNLASLDWITEIARTLHRGFILTVDYGYSSEKYYSPMRSEGTLQCYFQHRYHNNPYIHVGYQDLTTHVNFTALENQGQLWGLETVGLTQQGLFLMALGLGQRLSALTQTEGLSLGEVLRRREALHSLINPMGLGNFRVLIQSKGLESQQPIQLKGLRGAETQDLGPLT